MLPRLERRSFWLRAQTRSAPHDAEFLFLWALDFSEPSTDSWTVASTAEKHQGSIQICIVAMPARHANKLGLTAAARRVDLPTVDAGLGAVRCWDFQQEAPCPNSFVLQKLNEATPPAVENGSIEASFLPHILSWVLLCPTGTLRHVPHLQLLDDHFAVAFGIVLRFAVQDIVPLPSDLAVQTTQPQACFLTILTSFLPSGLHSLCSSDTFLLTLKPARMLENASFGISQQIHNPTVDRNWRTRRRNRLSDFDHAGNRCEPLVNVSSERTGFWSSFDRTVDHSAQCSQFWEHNRVSFKAPTFGMRLADGDVALTFLFPVRSVGELFEAALPSLVEFDQKLSTNVSRNISEPRELSAKFLQLVDLIESSRIAAVVLDAREIHQALRVRQIPKYAKSTFPFSEPSFLLRSGVDAVAEGFSDLHRRKRLPQQRLLHKSNKAVLPPHRERWGTRTGDF